MLPIHLLPLKQFAWNTCYQLLHGTIAQSYMRGVAIAGTQKPGTLPVANNTVLHQRYFPMIKYSHAILQFATKVSNCHSYCCWNIQLA